MMKFYTPVGEHTQTTGGVAICKEVTSNEDHCPGCFFSSPDNCDLCEFIACCSSERPDGKDVIFIKEGGME